MFCKIISHSTRQTQKDTEKCTIVTVLCREEQSIVEKQNRVLQNRVLQNSAEYNSAEYNSAEYNSEEYNSAEYNSVEYISAEQTMQLCSGVECEVMYHMTHMLSLSPG